jgi:prepilin-type processing-associated H-X9-DG protein
MSKRTQFDPRSSSPTEIRKQGEARLQITWADGHVSIFESPFLRGSCPCASCVDELTGERKYGVQQAPDGVGIKALQLVGNYAVQIDWSDTHSTGIYSFDYLRGLCRCESCTSGR